MDRLLLLSSLNTAPAGLARVRRRVRTRPARAAENTVISLAYSVGMLLALTRMRPRTEIEAVDAQIARTYA